MPVDISESNFRIFYKNLIGGLGWGLGATVGLAIFLAIAGYIVGLLGGIPVVGEFLARIIESTQEALN